jgi:hypothetical protein
MRKYSPSVLKAVWFEPPEDAKPNFDKSQTEVPSALVALLYSDNVVR